MKSSLENLVNAFNRVFETLGEGRPFELGSLKLVRNVNEDVLEELRKAFTEELDDLFKDIDYKKALTLFLATINRDSEISIRGMLGRPHLLRGGTQI
ncbi:hypothetical protein EYM_05345 [Ignicoccus islandicus DSM 13165]|uniref:Uncharacterized protein n=1 Tax=Ignicoccus islandicus DSM 13165 TaxID=940295 RepID=A0A0U2VF06_9CREN|nr:hypothetical protein [Ignicoccus islandicus]ALU12578.1 hypothetical protein EYM_05345 [Ignicoccus islandicus DSM 13165]